MDFNQTENDILSEAEDVILKKLRLYNGSVEAMTKEDVYDFQIMVITFARILAMKRNDTGLSGAAY